MIYILTVLLVTTTPMKVFKTESYDTLEECLRWADFYNEYPFQVSCTPKAK